MLKKLITSLGRLKMTVLKQIFDLIDVSDGI